MDERGTGVFSSVSGALQDNEKDALVTLESIEPGSGDSIYDLIFSEYDEENKE